MYEEWPEITAETSMEEIKEIHQRIWDYVIKHGKKPKTPYYCNCALCEYAIIVKYAMYDDCVDAPYSIRLNVYSCRRCALCPFKSEVDSNFRSYSGCLGGLWSRWRNYISSRDYESAKEIAAKIRDIEICTDEEMQERIKKVREKYILDNEV